MAMDSSVSIVLDHERTLRYDWEDFRDICKILTRLQPGDRPERVTQNKLITLLYERDPEAMQVTLYQGLRRDDQRLRADQMGQILAEYVRNGGDLEVVYDQIAEAFFASGVIKRPSNWRATENGASGNGSRASGS